MFVCVFASASLINSTFKRCGKRQFRATLWRDAGGYLKTKEEVTLYSQSKAKFCHNKIAHPEPLPLLICSVTPVALPASSQKTNQPGLFQSPHLLTQHESARRNSLAVAQKAWGR